MSAHTAIRLLSTEDVQARIQSGATCDMCPRPALFAIDWEDGPIKICPAHAIHCKHKYGEPVNKQANAVLLWFYADTAYQVERMREEKQ